MLRNPAYQGTAMFGRTRSIAAGADPAASHSRPFSSTRPDFQFARSGARKEWISIPVPAIVDVGLFDTVQAQLDENRRRRRDGRRRPGWLLQGLVVCGQCGYAFYGKMARGLVGGRQLADYGYYRCTGTDAQQIWGPGALPQSFGAQRQAGSRRCGEQVEMVLDDPQRVAAEHERRATAALDGKARRDVDAMDRQIARLRRGIDRLIDAYAEGLIEVDEFRPRLAGLKQRLARLQSERETATAAHEAERSLHLVIGRLRRVCRTCPVQGWINLIGKGRREVIRALVRRIEIDQDQVEVVFRIPGAPPPPDNGSIAGSGGESPGYPTSFGQYCGRSYGPFIGENAALLLHDAAGPELGPEPVKAAAE